MTTTLLFSLSKTPDLYFCILAQNGIENVELPLGRAVVVIITEIISVSINLEIHYKVWQSDLDSGSGALIGTSTEHPVLLELTTSKERLLRTCFYL